VWFPLYFSNFQICNDIADHNIFIAIIMILLRVEGAFKLKIREVIQEAMETGRLPKTKIQRSGILSLRTPSLIILKKITLLL